MGAGVVAALYDCGAPGLRGELRRRGEHPDGVAESFVKVVELQARTLGYRGRAHEHRRLARDAYRDDLGRDAPATTWPRSDTNIARVVCRIRPWHNSIRMRVGCARSA